MTSSTSLYSGTPGNANVASRNFTTLYSGQGTINPQQAYGNANVVSLLAVGTDGANTVGNIIAAGNVTADYFIGNFQGNISGNITVTGSNTEVLFNNAGNVGAAPGLTFNSASNVLATTGSITATGNITGGNINTAGQVSATGNVTGNYILGNGSQLTGLPATYGNANVVTLLAAFGSNTVSTTGNVTAGYFVGNGSQLTGLPASYSNANVASFMAAFGSNTISSTGNITTTANISGGYILGNGSQLTGLPATYGNANVAAFMAAFGSNSVSTTGNVSASYFVGNGSLLTNINAGNIVGAYGNANVANFLANFGSNTISTTGNVDSGNVNTTGGVYVGGVVSAVGNVRGGNINTGGLVTATGNVTGGNITTGGAVSATGNISSAGNVLGAYLWGDGGNITGVVAGAHTVQFEVKNTSGGTITKGTPVYATGTVGATTVVEVSASRADTAATMPALGILEQDLAVNAFGLAISVGTLNNVNTSLLSLGQELYVAAAGGFTNARPSDSYVVQKIGTVGRVSATTGTILVNIWNIEDLPNLGTGNIWVGNAGNIATQTVLATYTGNIGAGNISVTGNISGGNIVIPNAKRYYGDFSSGATAGRTYFQTTNTGTTAISVLSVLPGPNHVAVPGQFGAATGLFSTNDTGNSSVFGMYSYPTEAQFRSTNTGTGNVNDMTFKFGSSLTLAATLSSTGNFSTTGNITAASGKYFVGDGGLLSNIAAANVTGTVGLAQYVTANAQANITSVGTLSSLSVTGNVSPGNVVLPNAGKLRGDFSSSPAGGRTVIQTTGTGTTAQTTVTAIPGVNHVATAGTFGAATGLFSSNDFANTSIFGMYSYPNESQIRSTNLGTGTVNDITFKFGSGLTLGATLSSTGNFSAVGNVTGANMITSGSLVATANVSANLLFASTYVSTPALFTSELTPPSGGPLQTTTSLSTISGNLSVTGNVTCAGVSALGSIKTYNQAQYALATSGTVNIDKTNAQVQYLAPTANVTIGSLQNFVTTQGGVTQSDTVTLIIKQGATPYVVTMPTGNASIKYAGNVTTVGTTANAVTMISITGANVAGSALYMVTVSPEFV